MGHKSKKTLQSRRDFHFLCIPGPPQKQKKHYRTAEIFVFYASLDHHKSKKTLQNRRDFHFLCIPGPPQKQKNITEPQRFAFSMHPWTTTKAKKKNTTEPQRFSFSMHPWTTTKAKKHYRTAEIFIFYASLDHHNSKKTLQNRRDFHFLCIPG